MSTARTIEEAAPRAAADEMAVDVSVRLPRDPQMVALARALVRRTLGHAGTCDEIIRDVELAVHEACVNAVQHAAGTGSYDVAVHVRSRACVVSITDEGIGFDCRSSGGATGARGRGLDLIRALMDGVHVVSRPGEGTDVILMKALPAHRRGPAGRRRSNGQVVRQVAAVVEDENPRLALHGEVVTPAGFID